jgi:indolepyruvate ferredoxin oxidoreductase beta subunit
LSDAPIASDLIALGTADMIISLEPMEALRYLPYLSKDGWIITSAAPFKNIPNYPDEEKLMQELKSQPHVVVLDVENLAKENHMPKSANVILLGAAAPFLKILDAEVLRESVGRIFASKGEEVVQMNYHAFDIGHEYVKQLKF